MSSPPSALIETLANHGVEVIFSLSGNQIMPLYDACIDSNIRIIHTRHEASAVYMAEAYAQMSGKIGVALVTAGPGLLNAVSALYSAARSESPVLLISGDAALSMDGRGGFQELDQISVTSPIVKHGLRPKTADGMITGVGACIAAACNGTPGPVHLALAFDVLAGDADVEAAYPATPPVPTGLADTDLATIIDALAHAERPLVITGPQANRTRQPDATAKLEAALGIPIICLESARGLSDSFYGDLGAALKAADLIIHLGKQADYSTGIHAADRISAETRLISVLTPDQPAPNLAQSERQITLLRAPHIPTAMTQLAAAAGTNFRTKSSAGWLQQLTADITRRLPWQDGADGRHPARVTASLQGAIRDAENPILVADGGEFCQWVQAGCVTPRRLINGPSGAIGGGIAYAIGTSIACPDATVFLVMGDGTAGFYFAELNSAVRAGCKIVAMIGNDFRWNAEVQIQIDTYGPSRVYGCDLDDTADYATAASGLGLLGQTVGPDDDLDDALSAAVAHDGPALLNVLIDGQPAPKFMPMKL